MNDYGIGAEVDHMDFYVEAIDLLNRRQDCEIGVAMFAACFSAIRKSPVQAGLLILGDLSIQGNIKPLRSLTEPLQVAMDNGAAQGAVPIENKRNFLGRQRGHYGARGPDILRRSEGGGLQSTWPMSFLHVTVPENSRSWRNEAGWRSSDASS